jgi:hypothetical protein
LNGLKYTKYALPPPSKEAGYGADDISSAPQAADFLSRFYNIPDTGKIPLYRCNDRGKGRPLQQGKGGWLKTEIGTDLRSGPVVELTTISGKKLPFNASDFEYPQGYKRKGNLTAVTFSSRQKETMNDAINDLGFTSEIDDSHKKSPVQSSGQSAKQK